MYTQKSYQASEQGSLYLVATPIGNLEDMTYRAVRILNEVDLILAEDTRNSMKLLNHFDIHTPIKSHHQHSHPHEIEQWIDRMLQGESIALISDAGMPLINDPGDVFVREAIANKIAVIPLPGANAALSALIASGIQSDRFTYYGFLPRGKSEQADVLEEVGLHSATAIFYESPYRVEGALKHIAKILGGSTSVVIGRELTKKFEEFIRGTVDEVLTYLADHSIKGECVLLVAGGSLKNQTPDSLSEGTLTYQQHVNLLMDTQGVSSKEAIKAVAALYGVKKQVVYQAYHIDEKD